MTAASEEDLVPWFGDEGARIIDRLLTRALQRARARGLNPGGRGVGVTRSIVWGRRALVMSTLKANANTRRQFLTNERGRSFHFKITHVANDDGQGRAKAIKHETYIERDSATEKLGEAVAHQAYLENGEKVEASDQRSAFGTIGETRQDREAFWDKFARSLHPRSRIQHRIIASLPHELSASGRLQAVKAFCRETFENRGIPFFAAIHAPTADNDDRNFHVHIAFASRPASQIDGVWDFERTPPQKQHPAMRAELQQIRRLRRRFAIAVNEHIEREAAGLPYFAGRLAKRPKHNLDRTARALLKDGRSLEKSALHVRRIFENEVIETERQAEEARRKVHDGAHGGPGRIIAPRSKRRRLQKWERALARSRDLVDGAASRIENETIIQRTLVSIIDRGGKPADADEEALLQAIRSAAIADLAGADRRLREAQQRDAVRLWKLSRHLHRAIKPQDRYSLPALGFIALENTNVRQATQARPTPNKAPKTPLTRSLHSGPGRGGDGLSV